MTHASLRAVGQVEGGADGVIDAIREVIGPGGTMLMVLGALDDHAGVNERAEPERAALLADAQPFDAGATPAAPDVGVLAEVFRRRPETIVNAEAVPVDDGPYRVVEGGADVPRRVLADEDIDAVIAAEIDERWRAIDEYARREQPTEARASSWRRCGARVPFHPPRVMSTLRVVRRFGFSAEAGSSRFPGVSLFIAWEIGRLVATVWQSRR